MDKIMGIPVVYNSSLPAYPTRSQAEEQNMSLLRKCFAYAEPDTLVNLAALCPACHIEHNFLLDARYAMVANGRPVSVWEFNGDYECPSFTPSMGANMRGQDPSRPRCHSFVTDGKWHFEPDSTHELAGHTVPMVPVGQPTRPRGVIYD